MVCLHNIVNILKLIELYILKWLKLFILCKFLNFMLCEFYHIKKVLFILLLSFVSHRVSKEISLRKLFSFKDIKYGLKCKGEIIWVTSINYSDCNLHTEQTIGKWHFIAL